MTLEIPTILLGWGIVFFFNALSVTMLVYSRVCPSHKKADYEVGGCMMLAITWIMTFAGGNSYYKWVTLT